MHCTLYKEFCNYTAIFLDIIQLEKQADKLKNCPENNCFLLVANLFFYK